MTGIELGDADACLTLTPDDPVHTPAQYVLAELRAGSLIATRRILRHYASGFADLVQFFEALAANWRGWPATRVWESLEHDLRIQARHDGHIRLEIRLQDTAAWTWSATAHLTLEPGEQLTTITSDLQQLTSPG